MYRKLAPEDQYDQALLDDLIAKIEHTNVSITVIPGRYWHKDVQEINDLIAKDDTVLIFVTGDEENVFPIDQLSHPNMIVWQQTPHPNTQDYADHFLPLGYTPYTRSELKKYDGVARPLKYFFAGQITHTRRTQASEGMKPLKGGLVYETLGFNQGISQTEYCAYLAKAKTVPCPSGAVIQESFRLYEALEASALPIADNIDPKNVQPNYWQHLYGISELPFPTIDDWLQLPGTIDYFYDTYPKHQNIASAWWQQYKHHLKTTIEKDIHKLTGIPTELSTADSRVTVLIPTSPIKDHPDTKHIDLTIESVRHHLPTAQIIVMIDGVRKEQQSYDENYQLYLHRLLWKTNHVWENVTPILFKEHLHQAQMTRETLKHVQTPCVLFVEHDTPLVTDYEIPMLEATQTLLDDKLDAIRFLHEADIHPEHQHLMMDTTPQNYGLPILRTGQWSQRPHLASTTYYRHIIDTYFSDRANTMIEDRIHGITQQAFLERGKAGWNEHRIGIYAPEGNRKRSYTTDGRGSDPKFEMVD